MFQWIQFIMFHYSVPPTLNKYQHYLFKGNMNKCIYPCSVPRCYPPEVYHQDGLQPRTSPGPGFRTSKTPSLGSRKSSLSNHSSRPSSCSSRSCSPRPRLRRESAQVFKILVKWKDNDFYFVQDFEDGDPGPNINIELVDPHQECSRRRLFLTVSGSGLVLHQRSAPGTPLHYNERRSQSRCWWNNEDSYLTMMTKVTQQDWQWWVRGQEPPSGASKQDPGQGYLSAGWDGGEPDQK